VQGEYGILVAGGQDRVKAMKALRRALALSPNNSRYVTALAAVQLDADDVQGAEGTLIPYLRGHPDDPYANYLIAEVYNHKPRTAENVRLAIEHLERSLSKNRANARVYVTLGQLYQDTQQTKKALQVYLRGKKVSPRHVPLYSGLMQCYARLGDKIKHREAAATMQRLVAQQDRKTRLRHALGFNKSNTNIALELGRIFEDEGDYQRALIAYEHAVRLSPGNQRALRAKDDFVKRLRVRMARQRTTQSNAVVQGTAAQGKALDSSRVQVGGTQIDARPSIAVER
jgi:cytochrome c-type biogenesis protein CcmH/NrfG